jgi:hypothetical protein
MLVAHRRADSDFSRLIGRGIPTVEPPSGAVAPSRKTAITESAACSGVSCPLTAQSRVTSAVPASANGMRRSPPDRAGLLYRKS